MLKELAVNNFLSYEKEHVTFPANATIAVVGDNGHGKSSLLEAIPFALFGEGRTNLAGMVRNGSTGGMKVRLSLRDLPCPDSELVIERGMRASGGGYTKVWVDDTLMAKGGASPGNNKAQDFINSTLGTDAETFFLTSFFGLGANDKLMQVRSSERLETMQTLGGVNICQKFHSKAGDMAKAHEATVAELQTSISVLESGLDDSDELVVNLENLRQELEQLQNDREDMYAQRNSLLKDEDRYRKLVAEKNRISGSKAELSKRVEHDEKKINRLRAELKTSQKEASTMAGDLLHQNQLLSACRPADDINALDKVMGVEMGKLSAIIDLKSKVLGKGFDTCPLCSGKVSEHSQERWVKEVSDAKERSDEIVRQTSKNAEDLRRIDNIKSHITLLESDMKYGTVEGSEIIKQGSDLKKDISRNKSELEKVEARYLKLNTELSEFDEVMLELQSLDETLDITHSSIGATEQKINTCKENIQRYKAQMKSIKGFKKELTNAQGNAMASRLVKEAFSRYAIPVQLLRAMRDAIEKRASRIYRAFGSGRIRLVDTEGARPGIDFVLDDENGMREYKVLSMGEKVMMFVAIRVAITDIVNKSHDHKIQFLILDEVAGNLSPKNRESLTLLINKLLRTYFPQVFMVSHVGLRDIFTKTLDVTKVDGVSHVK